MRILSDLPPQAIDRIERRVRPGQYSEEGFLYNHERVVDVVARDEEALARL